MCEHVFVSSGSKLSQCELETPGGLRLGQVY